MAIERTLLWFRNDLRLQDNRALDWAVKHSISVIPVFIFHEYTDSLGAASRWWLHHALKSLASSIEDLDSRLCFYQGAPLNIIEALCRSYSLTSVVWNREYEPWTIARDTAVKSQLEKSDITVHSFQGNVLKEPWQETKKDGSPYKVFTPFWRNLHSQLELPKPLAAPTKLPPFPTQQVKEQQVKEGRIALEDAQLLPVISWDTGLYNHWPEVSEKRAHDNLTLLMENGTHTGYQDSRNFPAINGTTLLSPFLRWGIVTPQRHWWEIFHSSADQERAEPLLRQFGWRDFAHSLLFHFPDTVNMPMDKAFEGFAWLDEEETQEPLALWQRGQTGYPIVDAGMRQLWATGWMHNRVRMIVGSFLVKHLLIHWRYGAAWFWDTLVDADLANNTMGWQWIAGCGADAAPYFRIFNPMSQGEKFDTEGVYVKRWVPELKHIPAKYIHRPWEAPELVLRTAGVALGRDYPRPIISHEEGRVRALRTYKDRGRSN